MIFFVKNFMFWMKYTLFLACVEKKRRTFACAFTAHKRIRCWRHFRRCRDLRVPASPQKPKQV
jgi:hypothetical protein